MNRIYLFFYVILTSIIAMADEPVVFQMPTNENVYFKAFFYTNSKYFQFNTNGTYRQINREHMYVNERDHGTWSQNELGELTLVSQEHYRDIECAPLVILVWHSQAVMRLPWINLQLTTLLTNSKDQTFTTEQIEGIEKCGYENLLSRISVDDCSTNVPREKISELSALITQYLDSPEKNHFHLIPMTYKDQTFLLWKDSQLSFNHDLNSIRETLDDQKPDTNPAFIFTRIDKDTFQNESSKTQEFIFYPLMNFKNFISLIFACVIVIGSLFSIFYPWTFNSKRARILVHVPGLCFLSYIMMPVEVSIQPNLFVLYPLLFLAFIIYLVKLAMRFYKEKDCKDNQNSGNG